MKKSMVIVISLVLVILSGYQSNSLPDTESFPETKPTVSFSDSKTEPTESEIESSDMTDETTESGDSNEHIHSSKQENSSQTQSIPTNNNQSVTNSERDTETETKPSEEPMIPPELKPSEQQKPNDDSNPTPTEAPPAQTETATSVPPQETPPQPKSIYDFEFDIDAIRAELIAVGEGMGLTHSGNLTPDNASWFTPVTASANFQGANLERRLKDYVQSMPELITAYGGNPIQYFTIYAEPLGGGSYRIYFLY